MDGLIRKRLVVRGHVQGVFFRETTRREAERRGVTGWVRNQPDGSVEAVLEGEAEAVERVIERCRSGPPGARVDAVDVVDEAAEGLPAFEVL
jgi:acylphosphatase